MKNSHSLADRIAKIEQRNKKVELDKSWETSLTRKITIALSTYLIIGLFMTGIGVTSPWLNAIIPTMGFIISTLTVPYVKKVWLKYRK